MYFTCFPVHSLSCSVWCCIPDRRAPDSANVVDDLELDLDDDDNDEEIVQRTTVAALAAIPTMTCRDLLSVAQAMDDFPRALKNESGICSFNAVITVCVRTLLKTAMTLHWLIPVLFPTAHDGEQARS